MKKNCKISYVPEQYIHNKSKIKVELDLSNYVTKSDLKNVTGIDLLLWLTESVVVDLDIE